MKTVIKRSSGVETHSQRESDRERERKKERDGLFQEINLTMDEKNNQKKKRKGLTEDKKGGRGRVSMTLIV
jgi:hypothetical protein